MQFQQVSTSSSRRQILAQTSRTKDLPRKRGHKSRPEGLGVHHSPDNFFSLVAEAIKAEDGPGKYAFSARGSFISSVEVFDKYWHYTWGVWVNGWLSHSWLGNTILLSTLLRVLLPRRVVSSWWRTSSFWWWSFCLHILKLTEHAHHFLIGFHYYKFRLTALACDLDLAWVFFFLFVS